MICNVFDCYYFFQTNFDRFRSSKHGSTVHQTVARSFERGKCKYSVRLAVSLAWRSYRWCISNKKNARGGKRESCQRTDSFKTSKDTPG